MTTKKPRTPKTKETKSPLAAVAESQKEAERASENYYVDLSVSLGKELASLKGELKEIKRQLSQFHFMYNDAEDNVTMLLNQSWLSLTKDKFVNVMKKAFPKTTGSWE